MMMFLCFFSVACFASTFIVPSGFERSDLDSGGRVMYMENPSAVGLQRCEIGPGYCDESVVLQNMSGEKLLLSVHRPVVENGDRIFGAYCEGSAGDVWFVPQAHSGGCLSIECAYKPPVFYDLGCLNLWKSRRLRCYYIGQNSLTVRKFFGDCADGSAVFVSATVVYNDLQNIVLRYGKAGEGWLDDGVKIGHLCVAS